MMMRMFALLLCLPGPAAWAQDLPAFYRVTGVAADDVLNIRALPDATAEIIGSLPPEATGVEVTAVEGDWAVVNTGERSGYAALAFLQLEEGLAWNSLESPLTCLGTEPFWSLEIDPAKGETRYLTPEDPEPQVAPITTRWPGRPWSFTAAVALPDGLAVLAPAECSDGMSDLSYGIAVDIFLQLEGAPRLSGCCRLGLP